MLGGVAVIALSLLGVWQIQRRAWKLELIAEVNARVNAAPVAAPGPETWAAINAAHDAYRRVRADGVLLNSQETLVQAVTALGAGYWVMVPLQTDDGFIILVNRGFVAPDHAEPSRHAVTAPTSRAEVTGLLRMTEPKGGFLQANDPAADHWHSRDVAAIAQKRGLTQVAPYFIDSDRMPGDQGGPIGGLTVIDFPNNHLVYALTWFALAGMAGFGTLRVARDIRQV